MAQSNVNAFVRLSEKNELITDMGSSLLFYNMGDREKIFELTHVCDENQSQEECFKQLLEPSLLSFFSGFNQTIFVYGQKCENKYTLFGKFDSETEYGMAAQAMAKIFEIHHNADEDSSLCITVNYVEFHDDRVYDLMSSKKTSIRIFQDVNGQAFLHGYTEIPVLVIESGQHILKICSDLIRTPGSHGVLTLNSYRNFKTSSGEKYLQKTVLRFVDCGSINEHNVDPVELAFISLSCGEEINFKQVSNLTQYLREDFLGHTQSSVLMTLSNNSESSLSALKFLNLVKDIIIDPKPAAPVPKLTVVSNGYAGVEHLRIHKKALKENRCGADNNELEVEVIKICIMRQELRCFGFEADLFMRDYPATNFLLEHTPLFKQEIKKNKHRPWRKFRRNLLDEFDEEDFSRE